MGCVEINIDRADRADAVHAKRTLVEGPRYANAVRPAAGAILLRPRASARVAPAWLDIVRSPG